MLRGSRVKKLVVVMALYCGAVGAGVGPGASPAGAADEAKTETGCEGYSDSVARLYRAAFLRPAEQDGFDYWMATYTSGDMSLTQIAEFFSGSQELQDLYGDLNDADYVDRVYRNVLDRGPDPEGLAHWLGEMAAGMDRGTVLLRFTESPEFVGKTGTAEPTDGYFGNGLTGMWQCTVDHGDIAAVSRAFAEAVAAENTTTMSILAGEPVTLDASLPELELGAPALFLDAEDPSAGWCERIGDFGRQCFWFLLEDGSTTWTLRMVLAAEDIDFDGSGWTGRYIVVEHEVTEVGS